MRRSPQPRCWLTGTRTADPDRFTDAQIALIRRAALDPEVARIFVHPGIKQAMCDACERRSGWLAKVRPWWGHDAHFHVRLACPAGEQLAAIRSRRQRAMAAAQDLAWWLTDEPWQPKPPGPPPKPLTLADLPAECAAVLRARGTDRAG